MDIEQIFFDIRKKEKLSRDELYSLGADEDYIEWALEEKILIQCDDNYYTMGNARSLLLYGRKLLDDGNIKAANMLFDCAYEVDMEDFDINCQLFYRALKQIKVKKNRIFKHFDIMYERLVGYGRDYDANYYMFLLGNLYGTSDKDNKYNQFDKYKDVFIDLEESNILIPFEDSSYYYENMIRKNVFSNLYHNVNTIIDKRFADGKHMSLEDLIEKELLLKWIIRKRTINKELASYLQNNDMESVKNLLNKEDERRNLTNTNEYILKLVNSYLTIQKNGIIPIIKYNGDNLFEAIDGNNYKLALDLVEKRMKDYSEEKENNLHMMLKSMEKLISSKKVLEMEDVKLDNSVLSEIRPIKTDLHGEYFEFGPHINTSVPLVLTNREMQSIDSKVKELHKGRSIYLLDPMSKEKRRLIREYVSTMYDDIVAFSIGDEATNERRLVLRYKPIVTERINISATANEAYSLYLEGNTYANDDRYNAAQQMYEESAEKYALLLMIGKPIPKTYARFGKTLLKLRRKSEALDCLKVATILSLEQGDKYDFSELIENIEFPQERENRKPKVVVNESEFVDKKESSLNKELINDIIGLTSEGELSIEEACIKLGLSEDDTNYIKLLYARDCYYLGNNSVGEKYLKQVVRCKKSEEVMKLYKDILVNKNYYCKRLDKNIIFIKK